MGGFAGGIATLAEGKLYALQNAFALDGRVSAYPGSARGHSVANSYLVTQSNAALLIDTALPPRTALLECVFVLDCVADRKLDVGRFLPPLPLRIVVDNRLNPRNNFEASAASLARAKEQPIDPSRYRALLAKLVPPMLAAAETAARGVAATEIGAALTAADLCIWAR